MIHYFTSISNFKFLAESIMKIAIRDLRKKCETVICKLNLFVQKFAATDLKTSYHLALHYRSVISQKPKFNLLYSKMGKSRFFEEENIEGEEKKGEERRAFYKICFRGKKGIPCHVEFVIP